MRSERDAGKKPNAEGQGGPYRLIPLRGQNGRDEEGIKTWGGTRITSVEYLIPSENKIK